MVFRVYLKGEGMPITYKKNQAFVKCCGDIVLTGFLPKDNDGSAALLLRQGFPGDPGRDLSNEEIPKLDEDIDNQEGVFIEAKDYRSLDAIIRALCILRGHLKSEIIDSIEVTMKTFIVTEDFEQEKENIVDEESK